MKTEADLILEDISDFKIQHKIQNDLFHNTPTWIRSFHPKAQTTRNVLSYMYPDYEMFNGYRHSYFYLPRDILKIISLLEDMQ